jgi:hypothetical protein
MHSHLQTSIWVLVLSYLSLSIPCSIFEYQLEPVCDESTLVDLPNPCKQFISTYFEESMGSVAGLAVAIGVIEVFAMLNLCALLFSEKDKVSDDIGQWHG